MPEIIICANFDVEKLRGLGNTGGQILGSPIEMAGHPYNSAALLRSLWLGDFWYHSNPTNEWNYVILSTQTAQLKCF